MFKTLFAPYTQRRINQITNVGNCMKTWEKSGQNHTFFVFCFFLEAQLNENCYFFTFQQVEKTVEMLKIERCVVNKGKNDFLTVLKNRLFLYFLYEVVDLRLKRA